MPIFELKAPDGRLYEVDAPDQDSAYKAFTQYTPSPRATPKVDRKEAGKEALQGTSVLERALINLGAGLDTAWTGLKDLTGNATDDEVRAQRERASAASESLPYAGPALQFAGEVGPTMAIPGAGFVRGAQMLTKAAPTVARLGTKAAAADAAIGGAFQGALQATTEEESRVANAIIGAVGGAAFTSLLAAGRPIRDMLTQGGALSKAAQRLIEAAGGPEKADAIIAKLRAYSPDATTRDIPMTVGEIAQNPAMARQERNAAARFTDDWAPFRKAQHDERYNALQKATSGADNLQPATAARDAATAPLRDDALSAAAGGDYTSSVTSIVAGLRDGASGANPAVKSIAGYVEKELTGDNMTPARMYEVRKVLLSKLNGKTVIGDELSSAAKTARRETMSVVDAIDDAIDGASGGKWKPYLAEYANKSKEVDSAKAQKLIRGWFDREGASQTLDVPDVTGFRLGKAVEKHGQNSYGSTLDAGARARIDSLRGNLDMSEGLQKLLRGTGTSGGGSNTAMDMTGIAADMAQDKASTLIPALGRLIARSDRMTQAAMSDALRNPDAFIAALSKKQAQRQPLTRSEESVLALLRSVGAGATLEQVQPQE